MLTWRVVGVSSAEEVARLILSRSGLRVQSATNRAQLDLHGRAFSDRPTDSAVQHFAMVTRPRRRCVGSLFVQLRDIPMPFMVGALIAYLGDLS